MGVELMSSMDPIRGVWNWGVAGFRNDKAGKGDEKADEEIRGHFLLCSSRSETRRSIWWSVMLRMAVWSVLRRRAAFWKYGLAMC